jgi:pyrroloquinoline quinone biosynthesis protein D
VPEAGSRLAADARPRLAPKVRLRWDRKDERYMLLYPERGLVLNGTAAQVVKLCTGEHTVAVILARLAEQYADQPADALEREVLTFLHAMVDRGLIRTEP